MRKIREHAPLPAGLTRRRRGSPNVFLSYSSLDWYKLTENTRHVLNNIMTSSAKKQLEESMKDNPDQRKLEGYRSISLIVSEMTRDPKNFESKERMQEILEEYAPLEVV
jgi:hypothetical protein